MNKSCQFCNFSKFQSSFSRSINDLIEDISSTTCELNQQNLCLLSSHFPETAKISKNILVNQQQNYFYRSKRGKVNSFIYKNGEKQLFYFINQYNKNSREITLRLNKQQKYKEIVIDAINQIWYIFYDEKFKIYKLRKGQLKLLQIKEYRFPTYQHHQKWVVEWNNDSLNTIIFNEIIFQKNKIVLKIEGDLIESYQVHNNYPLMAVIQGNYVKIYSFDYQLLNLKMIYEKGYSNHLQILDLQFAENKLLVQLQDSHDVEAVTSVIQLEKFLGYVR